MFEIWGSEPGAIHKSRPVGKTSAVCLISEPFTLCTRLNLLLKDFSSKRIWLGGTNFWNGR